MRLEPQGRPWLLNLGRRQARQLDEPSGKGRKLTATRRLLWWQAGPRSSRCRSRREWAAYS
jgi:hypothetical protein